LLRNKKKDLFLSTDQSFKLHGARKDIEMSMSANLDVKKERKIIKLFDRQSGETGWDVQIFIHLLNF
jgi:hypothetical protein